MAVTARGKGFQAKFMLAGTRYVGQFVTKAEAEAWEAMSRLCHAQGKPIPAAVQGTTQTSHIRTVGDLFNHVERMHWRTKKSGKGLSDRAGLFVNWVGPGFEPQAALTPAKVDEYVIHLETERRLASATINRHLAGISVLLKYATRAKLIQETFELPWQREGKGRVRYFEDAEVSALLALLKTWGLMDYHDLFVFLVDTGARLGEAEGLQWSDIRGRSITFEDTKNGLTRTVTGTPRVMEALERQRKHDFNNKCPFDWLDRTHLRTLWFRLRGEFEWMGDDTVVHTFRHTCASRLVQRGVDLYRVQRWMGHKSIATTMRYAHLAPKHLEELADVLAA